MMGYRKSAKAMALVLLALALVCLSGAARAEMYVEAYLGGVQGSNASLNPVTASQNEEIINNISSQVPGRLNAAFQGGLKVGTWFVREGFLGYDYPPWMKYLGFYLDFRFHRLNYARQCITFTQTITQIGNGTNSLTGPGQFWSNGHAATLAFMFQGRYGFFPDSQVPFGRLQPYLAVGPALMFIRQEASSFLVPIAAGCATGIGSANTDSDVTLARKAMEGS